MHLANPNALNWGDRRVKNDVIDATDLADMFRLGRLGEAWIAPPAIRELRELVRYRAKLVQLRSGLKAQVHAVMAKEGVLPTVTTCSVRPAARQLDGLELGAPYAMRVQSLRELIGITTGRSCCSSATSISTSRAIVAIGRCRRSTASARSAPRCSSPRSVT